MTFKQAVRTITDRWMSIPVSQRWDKKIGYRGVLGSAGRTSWEAVWLSVTDHAGSYEVDEEWIGIFPDGSIAWAYASGCSCWDGEYEVKRIPIKDIKMAKFNHPENVPVDWKKKVIEFAEGLL